MPEPIRGRYEPIAVAGRGGEGEVIRARDLQHDRIVALKTRALGPDVDRDRVMSEARVLLSLTPHPYLPLVRDDFFDGDRYIMVVDWVEGKSLDRVLAERGDPGLTTSVALGYLAQVAQALDHLHAHDPPVIHQDVKPANIILAPDGHIVLVDFGIAGTADRLISAGTRGYMAPEIASGERASPSSDIFSLAATAFALITGAPPEGIRPGWEGVPPESIGVIERALRRALAIDPARRPASGRELLEQLRSWIDAALPGGVVTFLLTDIEGSTRAWEREPDEMARALARHDAMVAEAVERNGGRIVKTRGEGDSSFSVFADPGAAVTAAIDLQRDLARASWPTSEPLRVRAALHSGEAEVRDGDYYGTVVNRAARIRSVASGGQVVVSASTVALAADALPGGASFRDLGDHRLKDLSKPERLAQLMHPDIPSSFASLRSLDAVPNNLPAQLTSFVGRAREIAFGKELLASTRMLTLTGLGGSGKTRLALQVAAEMLDAFPGGVRLVELAQIGDGALVMPAIAAAVEVAEEPDRDLLATVVDALSGARALVILDTCEHLLSSCADAAAALLRACRELTVIATSSEPLGVAGETTLQVHTLRCPPVDHANVSAIAGFEAVELFVDRARQSKPGFALTDANASAVAQICARLDGIPLALELAAARVRALTPEQIAPRLDDRFRLLTGGARTALPHQQTMRAAMDWSYEPLSDREKRVFARLAAFSGGFTLTAAESVCAFGDVDEMDVLDIVTSLVEKSLIVADEDGDVRYRMLQTVLQYAREKLASSGDAGEVRARHLDHFEALVMREVAPEERARATAELEVEHDNLRAALEHASGERSLRLATAMTPFRRARAHWSEARASLERALDANRDASPGARADAENSLGTIAWSQGDLLAARSAFERALELYRASGDRAEVARASNNVGAVLVFLGDHAGARAALEESLATRRELGDARGAAEALNNLAGLALQRDDAAAARPLFEEALSAFDAIGDRGSIADVLGNLALVDEDTGDLASARAKHERVLAIREEAGDVAATGRALGMLGQLSLREGDDARAAELIARSLDIATEVGDAEGQMRMLRAQARLARTRGDLEAARTLAERSATVASENGAEHDEALALKELALAAQGTDEARAAAARALAIFERFEDEREAAEVRALI